MVNDRPDDANYKVEMNNLKSQFEVGNSGQHYTPSYDTVSNTKKAWYFSFSHPPKKYIATSACVCVSPHLRIHKKKKNDIPVEIE